MKCTLNKMLINNNVIYEIFIMGVINIFMYLS